MKPSQELLAAFDQSRQVIARIFAKIRDLPDPKNANDPEWWADNKIMEEQKRFNRELPAKLRDEARNLCCSLPREIDRLEAELEACRGMLIWVRSLFES